MTASTTAYKSAILVEVNELADSNHNVQEHNIKDLLEQYKDTIATTIIQQFGLGMFFDQYKDGGNVTTLHNAKQGVFANDEDNARFNQDYDRKNYEKDFPNKRKDHFKNNATVYDKYTGKKLAKDGTTHLDHVVSAKSIHDNDKARLYMNSDDRNSMATDDRNLAFTNSSLNQSKGEKSLDDWMDQENRKDKSKTNADYYDVDKDAAMNKLNEANKHIKSSVRKAEAKYYVTNVTATGVNQGLRMGTKQAIGMFLYEFQSALMTEMKGYFKLYKTLNTIEQKINEFKQACNRIKDKIQSKAKDILQSFKDGFIGGFVSNLITVFVNTFAKTVKNVARIINDGIHALIKAVKLLVKRPKEMTKKQALIEASKILTAAIVASVGVILTEAFATYLKTTPFAPFADLVANVLGGILTGIVAVTLVYAIDHFSDIMKSIGESFKLIQYQLTVSASEIRAIYQKAVAQIEEDYQLVLKKIFKEYEELGQLTALAYDYGALAGVQFKHSQNLAKSLGVKEKDILKTDKDIDDFFLN